MLANYHTHSYLCNHASGSMREYVLTAIENGLKVLGFSDHVPQAYKKGYCSYSRMRLDQIEEYVTNIKALKEEFKDKIEIYIGYEAEYYPAIFEDTLRELDKFGYDYLILGQHNINNEYDNAENYILKNSTEQQFLQYIKQVTDGIKTGRFTYVAHPDFAFYDKDKEVYRNAIEQLCDTANEYDVALEFNLLGFMEKRWYPYDEFWKIAAEKKVKVIIGCDAHAPEYVGKPDLYAAALNQLKKYGITPIETIKFK